MALNTWPVLGKACLLAATLVVWVYACSRKLDQWLLIIGKLICTPCLLRLLFGGREEPGISGIHAAIPRAW